MFEGFCTKPMNNLKRLTLKFVLLLSLGIFALSGCIKDKYKIDRFVSPDWQPGFGLPVATFNASLKNLLTEDSTLIFNGDSSISISFAQDSIAEQSVADIIEIPAQSPTSQTLKLGEIEIDNFSTGVTISLGAMVGNLSTASQTAINPLNGQTAPFPAFPEQAGGTYPMSSINDFSQVTFSSGSLDFTLNNTFPFPLDSFVLELRNSGGASLGFARFGNVARNTSQIRSIPLGGKVMSNSLQATIVKVSSAGNAVPTGINFTTQAVSLTASSNGLTIINGVVRIPTQDFSADTSNVDFATSDNEQIYDIVLKDGEVNFNFQSSIAEPIRIIISLPGIRKNNVAILDTVNVASNATTVHVIDLTNATIDLTTNTQQPYNQIPVIVKASLVSSGTLKSIDSSNALNVSYGFQDIDFSRIRGYFGQKNIEIDPGTIDLDLEFLKELGGDFLFASPDVRLNIQNSIGAPIRLGLDMTGVNIVKGNVSLNATPSILPFPSVPGQVANGLVTFNKNNSQIAQLLSLPPDTVKYGGSVLLNPAGNVGANFLTDNSKIRIDLELDLPLELSVGNMKFGDTSSFDGAGLFGDDGTVASVDLIFQTKNRFPFDITMEFTWLDSLGTQVYATTVPFVTAAPVGPNGRVNNFTVSTSRLSLSQSVAQNLKNATQLVQNFRLNTTNGTTVAKLYTDYNLETKIMAEIRTKGLF